jgi:hypothetical protein
LVGKYFLAQTVIFNVVYSIDGVASVKFGVVEAFFIKKTPYLKVFERAFSYFLQ